MLAPHSLLTILLGSAIGAAGILHGLHWHATRAPKNSAELEDQLRIASEENEMLKRENESLRSLAQGGGELSVPQELIDRTEREFGLRFLSNPIVHRIAGEELRDRIGAAIESRLGPSGIHDRQESYLLIGWLRPDDHLLAQLTALRSMGAACWFDDVTGEGWMLDRADLKNIPDQASLVSLLARILLHQHFPPPPTYPGDDAARAREALHQGAAAGAEARFHTEQARTIGFMAMKENHAFEQLLAALPPFLQGLTNFPAVDGKGLADSLYVQGVEQFQAAFRSPPQTTRNILFPGETTSAPTPLELPATPEKPFLTESAGQLGLRLWLEPLGDAGAASEIAATWKNDRYMLFPDGESSSAVLWEIELESADATDRLQAAALDLTAAISGRKQTANLAEIIVSPKMRNLSVTRTAPNRIRFLNTAEATTASQFGSTNK